MYTKLLKMSRDLLNYKNLAGGIKAQLISDLDSGHSNVVTREAPSSGEIKTRHDQITFLYMISIKPL